ncbi:hypothetical protein H4CHR_02974 [Variovorax sp. PBS-H4]|uniref:hypothetical protein n=1 Tax=Variovorax sp. PBS-H4 TaxID=434008 RepID=UPI001316976D|nr:hypothetical protein [Variovorax sp. PBS-H4]VTU32251.1 hypothetical protein H4CHR_02974 [Variovorax sp. PBS-H4]
MSKNKPTLTLKPAATEPVVDHAAPAAAAPETSGVPLSSMPELQAQVAQGLADGSLQIQGALSTEAQAAPAAATQGEAPAAPADEVKAPAKAWEIGDVVDLVIVHTQPLHHLHTGVVFGVEPVQAEIDAFIALQLNAGKLAIVPSAT